MKYSLRRLFHTMSRPTRRTKTVKAFKLFRLRRDGTLGSLFIGAPDRLPLNKWLVAEEIPTPGFKLRPGWHATPLPEAPHLGKEGRVWCEVELAGVSEELRPRTQGGKWYLAKWLKITDLRPDL